ncbi:hypothetical protein [Salinimicrobium sp. TH3]|uniref:hypothetical protein n=1 Tax=Salinimicrobium sp. TH3 TaxID=2997342 RepID=UPI002274E9F9|nr:hypothetical protein [Salinimicrobium sp. TH3]MCY2686939.1 hypothetical protein [Salinimicrobium sp. TH3]
MILVLETAVLTIRKGSKAEKKKRKAFINRSVINSGPEILIKPFIIKELSSMGNR